MICHIGATFSSSNVFLVRKAILELLIEAIWQQACLVVKENHFIVSALQVIALVSILCRLSPT